MFHHELMTMTLFAAVGVFGGLLRDLAPDKEAIWKFSPFPDLSLWRFVRRLPTRRDLRLPAFSLMCVLAIALAETLRGVLANSEHFGVFALQKKLERRALDDRRGLRDHFVFHRRAHQNRNSNRQEKSSSNNQLHLNEARLAASAARSIRIFCSTR